MRLLGNIIWILLGGALSAICWVIVGILWSITIIGLPVGLQCFKFASISLNPFGKEIRYGGGAGSLLMNIIWLFFGGVELALVNLVIGIIFCITVIGIPFGMQFFKIARLSLLPFGAVVERVDYI